MLQRSIGEYGRLQRADFTPRVLRRLQRFDERFAALTGDTIFDWSPMHYLRAKSYVGVLQIQDLQIELLPKIDALPEVDRGNNETIQDQQARQNLLFMLAAAGYLPLHERELASQSLRNMPLVEALTRVFARRLLAELRRGHQHTYVPREENLTCVKGRILLQQQFQKNAAHHHRMYVAYDDFSNDTWLNRIFKASCVALLTIARLSQTQQHLREILLELADVEDAAIGLHHFELVTLDRGSERFRELLNFCRILFQGKSPEPQAGESKTFSLLLPMEKLFEAFVGSMLRRHAKHLRFSRSDIHLQAQGQGRWLLRDSSGRGRFRLKPDVVIDGPQGQTAVILDTKWKRLVADVEDVKQGVAQSDMYQMYAYAQRYRCENNILLYPKVPGVTPKVYRLDGDREARRIKIAFLDLNYDLSRNRGRLISDLHSVIHV